MRHDTHRRTFGNLCLLALLSLLALVTAPARADVVVYSQPPNAAGGQYKSAWYSPDGLDGDEYVWDAFTLASSAAITQVQWRGAYTNYLSGAGMAPVYNFTVAIYPSIAGGSQPDIVGGYLVRYQVGGNAFETPAGIAGGVNMYDYHFTLPSPFQAAAGTKYWVKIYAWQNLTPTYSWPPDWSLARGTGGDGSHFRQITGGGYASISGDCAFTLLASSAPTATITATAQPVAAGSIMGAGSYPIGSLASLSATANTGWGFTKWTENGTQVSTNSTYNFTVSTNRTLVANFVPAYTITTNSQPTYGGTTSGDGIYNQGSTVTVIATPNQGFVFSHWSWFGTPISSLATYSFPAAADLSLTAEFAHVPGATTFDFDNAPVHTSLPISLTSDGLGALFTSTGGGYSIQAVGTVGISPAGFSGLCVYPNSVFAADLIVDFSQPLLDFSILYSTQELACHDSARMRVTAFLNGVQVGTNTATAPVPGTWPTGTLSITVPTGFDRAVVHYDAPPPTCQDYGVIFMADNLTVTRLCQPASITAHPQPATACASGSANFALTASGAGLTYQWQIQSAPSIWTDLAQTPVPLACGGSALATTPTASATDIAITPCPGVYSYQVRCVVSNGCGPTPSNEAMYTICYVNCDCSTAAPILNVNDFTCFLNKYAAGDPYANCDGSTNPPVLNVNDFICFTNSFAAGCP